MSNETETETTAEVVDIKKPTRKRKDKVSKPKAPKPTKKAAKVAKAKKDTSGPCACLCGETAKGGGFLPGHDSRLAGAVKRVISGKPFEGERAYVAKVAKSEHPALNTDHFHKLFAKLPG